MSTAPAVCAERTEIGRLLTGLSWTRLDIEIVARERVEFSAFPGSAIRGVFGEGLRRIACLESPRLCAACAHPESCVYHRLFDSARPPGATVLAGVAKVPAPYALDVSGVPGLVEPGSSLTFSMILVGEAANDAPFAIAAFRLMEGEGIGRGRGRFRVASVERTEGQRRRSGASREPAPLEVEFTTPTAIVAGGRRVVRPTFRQLVTAAVRRLTTLAHIHCGEEARFDVRGWLAAADEVPLEGADLSERVWDRWSRRQGRRLPMRGIVGRVRYGVAPPELELLVAVGGELGIGKGTTSGLGRLAVGSTAGGCVR